MGKYFWESPNLNVLMTLPYNEDNDGDEEAHLGGGERVCFSKVHEFCHPGDLREVVYLDSG